MQRFVSTSFNPINVDYSTENRSLLCNKRMILGSFAYYAYCEIIFPAGSRFAGECMKRYYKHCIKAEARKLVGCHSENGVLEILYQEGFTTCNRIGIEGIATILNNTLCSINVGYAQQHAAQ